MRLGRTIESCTSQLRSWRPFAQSDSAEPRSAAAPYSKRVCCANRVTAPFLLNSVLDMSKLSLFDDDKSSSYSASASARRRRFSRKRRRRGGSRSVSGRSSDRWSGANGTCSDFLMAAGSTDSSGDLSWVSDVSERSLSRDKKGNGGGERETMVVGHGLFGNCDVQVNESGYGSESGYKGDVELEYGDEEDDDRRPFFWGQECGENPSQFELVVENSLQKGHHRCRRKKHDLKMADTLPE